MSALRPILASFRRDERGATAIEYGLVAALIGVAAITSVSQIGTWIGSVFAAASAPMR